MVVGGVQWNGTMNPKFIRPPWLPGCVHTTSAMDPRSARFEANSGQRRWWYIPHRDHSRYHRIAGGGHLSTLALGKQPWLQEDFGTRRNLCPAQPPPSQAVGETAERVGRVNDHLAIHDVSQGLGNHLLNVVVGVAARHGQTNENYDYGRSDGFGGRRQAARLLKLIIQ
jgi:hypothetical protein